MTEPSAPLHLHGYDDARNMARFYRLSMSHDLFGAIVVIRQWGRIGTRGRELVERPADWATAQALIRQLASAKRRRGYLDVAP